MMRTAACTALLLASLLAGCAQPGQTLACDAPRTDPAKPGLMVSGQSPPGVYGISVPDVYYQSQNSFPRGAATVDERCM